MRYTTVVMKADGAGRVREKAISRLDERPEKNLITYERLEIKVAFQVSGQELDFQKRC